MWGLEEKMKRFFLYSFFLAVLFVILSDFCHDKTKGFQMSKMAFIAPYEEGAFFSQNSFEEKELLHQALNQPFYYLKKGRFCFVFISEDGNYVIKFLQRSPIEPPFWANWRVVRWMFPATCDKVMAKKKKQRELNFKSYELASTHFKKQSGIVYLHLQPSLPLEQQVVLYDNIKVRYKINADDFCFILQKKASPFCFYFTDLISLAPKKAYDLLSQFAFILKDRADKGIMDGDLSPRYNLGILDGKVMPFDLDSLRDIGIFCNKQEHMLQDAKKMFAWLNSTYPEASCFLEKEIQVISQLQ